MRHLKSFLAIFSLVIVAMLTMSFTPDHREKDHYTCSHKHDQSGTCAGTTKAGQPCKSKAMSGSSYCRWHNPNRAEAKAASYNDNVQDAKTRANLNQCKGTTKKGKRCRNHSQNEYCHMHESQAKE